MSEHGLLLIKDLRQKAIDGLMTQHRGVVVPQPTYFDEFLPADALPGEIALSEGVLWRCSLVSKDSDSIKWRRIYSPYRVGDKLYLQEPYRITAAVPYRHKPKTVQGIYLDDEQRFDLALTDSETKRFNRRKKPSAKTSARYMYKSLARYWFEVVAVKVEKTEEKWYWVYTIKRIEI